jgi:RimJ/RimL family protein N-acetyltransferase
MGKRHLAPLQAGRVRLRLLEEHDLPRTLAWRNQDRVRCWFFSSERLTPEQHSDWFARYRQRDDDFVFIIEEQSSRQTPSAVRPLDTIAELIPNPDVSGGRHAERACYSWRPIGQVAIYHVDWASGTAEFGRLMIGEPDATGRGLAREATAAATALALGQLGLQEIYLEVVPSNVRAIKVYEACGFEFTGRTERAVRMRIRAAA